MEEKNFETVMQLILYSGNAKSLAMEAIAAAKTHQAGLAQEKLNEANEAIIQAHKIQTQMLTKEAQGAHLLVDLLTVHSQDHLMTAISFIDLAQEIVFLYNRLCQVEEEA